MCRKIVKKTSTEFKGGDAWPDGIHRILVAPNLASGQKGDHKCA